MTYFLQAIKHSPESSAADCELSGILVAGDEVQVDQEEEENRGGEREQEEQSPQGDGLQVK